MHTVLENLPLQKIITFSLSQPIDRKFHFIKFSRVFPEQIYRLTSNFVSLLHTLLIYIFYQLTYQAVVLILNIFSGNLIKVHMVFSDALIIGTVQEFRTMQYF